MWSQEEWPEQGKAHSWDRDSIYTCDVADKISPKSKTMNLYRKVSVLTHNRIECAAATWHTMAYEYLAIQWILLKK